MRVFLSWSGARSKHVALCLRDWLPKVLQNLELWMSDEDIASGARWPSEIAEALESATVGIVCLTPENQKAEWLLFEAGALSKTLDSNSLLIPYLTEMPKSQLSGPLAQFQAEVADAAGTFGVLATLNKALGVAGIPQSTLEESFEVWWPRLQDELAKVPDLTEPVPTSRTDRDVLDEILENTREQLRREELKSETGMSFPSGGQTSHFGYEIFESPDGGFKWRMVRGLAIAVSDASYTTSEQAMQEASAVRDALEAGDVVAVDFDPA